MTEPDLYTSVIKPLILDLVKVDEEAVKRKNRIRELDVERSKIAAELDKARSKLKEQSARIDQEPGGPSKAELWAKHDELRVRIDKLEAERDEARAERDKAIAEPGRFLAAMDGIAERKDRTTVEELLNRIADIRRAARERYDEVAAERDEALAEAKRDRAGRAWERGALRKIVDKWDQSDHGMISRDLIDTARTILDAGGGEE